MAESSKAATNRKWASTSKFRDGWERTFGAKRAEEEPSLKDGLEEVKQLFNELEVEERAAMSATMQGHES